MHPERGIIRSQRLKWVVPEVAQRSQPPLVDVALLRVEQPDASHRRWLGACPHGVYGAIPSRRILI